MRFIRFFIAWAVLLPGMVPYVAARDAVPELPVLTVAGRGEAFATPDRAVVRLGAVAQDKTAAGAQAKVSRIMEEAIRSLRGLGIEDRHLSTRDLSVTPVFSDEKRGPAAEAEDPRIVGYRATNLLAVRVQDPALLGSIVDAGVNAGVNRLEGPDFEIEDDTFARENALVSAVQNAQRKAEVVVTALRMRLGPVLEVVEGEVQLIRLMDRGFRTLGAEAGAPVLPGEIRLEAQVTIRYRLLP